MKKTVVNCETGEVTVVDMTPEEVAADEAAAAAWEAQKAAQVPEQVPMWAVRTVLQNDGLFDQAQTLINESGDAALKNIWEYGNFAIRNSRAINVLAIELGLTDAQVDQMFRDANNLNV